MKNLKLNNKNEIIEFISNEFLERQTVYFDYMIEDINECKKFVSAEDNINSKEKEYSETYSNLNIYKFLKSKLNNLVENEVITEITKEQILKDILKNEVITEIRNKALNGFESLEHLIIELKKHFNLIKEEIEVVEEVKEIKEEKNDNNKLAALINEIRNNKTEGVITLEDGKTYTKVDYRLRKAREAFGFDLNIITNIVSNTGQEVVVRCEIQLFDARVNAFRTVATGTAVEARDKNVFNRFSYVEIAETSAIGRALANLGLFGNEYASANEITVAKAQQEAAKQPESKIITKTRAAKAEPEIKVDNSPISSLEIQHLQQRIKSLDINEKMILDTYNKSDLKDLTKDEYKSAIHKMKMIDDENSPI